MKPTTVTIVKALERQTELVELCKRQGTKFSNNPNYSNWSKLEEYEEELRRIHTSIRLVNATSHNDDRIKERELLTRRLDVLDKTDKVIDKKKKKFSLAVVTKWLQKKNVDTNQLREEILLKIKKLTDQLTEFNTLNTVTY